MSVLPLPSTAVPHALISSLPEPERVRERFLKSRIENWSALPDNLKATIKSLTKGLVRDRTWPMERQFTATTLVAIAQLLLALAPEDATPKLRRGVLRLPTLVLEAARLFAVLNPAAHAPSLEKRGTRRPSDLAVPRGWALDIAKTPRHTTCPQGACK